MKPKTLIQTIALMALPIIGLTQGCTRFAREGEESQNLRPQRYTNQSNQDTSDNQDKHRHYPSVNEKIEEKVKTYLLIKGLQGLEENYGYKNK